MNKKIYENLKPEIKRVYDSLPDDGIEQDSIMNDEESFN